MHPQFKKKKVLKYHRPGVSGKSVLNNQPSSCIQKIYKTLPNQAKDHTPYWG